MTAQAKYEVFADTADALGEAPFWCWRQQAFYWADIRGARIYRTDGAGHDLRHWNLPELVCGFALDTHGGAIVGLRSGFNLFDFETETLTHVASPEPELPLNRPNDGAAGPDGSYWSGTMRDGGGANDGSIYAIGADLACRRYRDDIVIPNGLTWSPDGRIFYFADSDRNVIYAASFDPVTGIAGEAAMFVDTASNPGKPDGAAVDEAGCLWSAKYGGGCVVRYDPGGRVDQIIRLPARLITSCAFAGRDFGTLLVTSARQKLTDRQIAEEPLSGAVFAVRPGVKGVPSRYFGRPDAAS